MLPRCRPRARPPRCARISRNFPSNGARARARGGAGKYVLFDCPGQIELYTHHHCMRNICERMQEEWDFRVCPEKSAERSEDIDDDDDDCIRHLVDRTKIDNNKNNDQSNKIIIIIIIIM